MDESKFSLQSSLEANYLNITMEKPVWLDEIAVRTIKADCPDFLVPFHIVDIDDKTVLKYKLPNMMALAYSNKSFYKKEFLKMYKALLLPFIQGKEWLMDYHYLYVKPEYIYINKEFTKLNYIYIPEKSYWCSDQEIMDFFRKILDNVTILDDNSFLITLYQYISKEQATLGNLYALLQKESCIETVTEKQLEENHSHVAESQNMQVIDKWEDKQAEQVESKKAVSEEIEEIKKKNTSSEDELRVLLFGDTDKKHKKEKIKKEKAPKEKNIKEKTGGEKRGLGIGLFGKKKMKDQEDILHQESKEILKEKAEEDYAQIFHEMDELESDTTEILEDEYCLTGNYLELVEAFCQGAPQRISLDFESDHITLGRSSSDTVQPDVPFDKSFRRIGRMHARIEKREEDFYVIDLGSANHTALNGEILIPNQPKRLQTGDELVFTPAYPIKYKVVL